MARAAAYPASKHPAARRRLDTGCSQSISLASAAKATTEPNPAAPATVTRRSTFSLSSRFSFPASISIPNQTEVPMGFIIALLFAFVAGFGIGLMR